MTEKDEEKFKTKVLEAFQKMLENNLQQKLTFELATGMLVTMEKVLNDKAPDVQST